MIANGEWLNPTRAVGIAAYGLAVVCSVAAWVSTRRARGDGRLAATVTFLETLLLLDIIFNWRWMLHAWIDGVAMRAHEYDMRKTPQQVAITVLAAVLLAGWLSAFRRLRQRTGLLLVVCGLLLSVTVWCVEVVSLHGIDHVFYHTVGGVMLVSLLWILSCTMTSAGLLIQSQQNSGSRTGATAVTGR